jgi:hypothetical protein
MTKAELLKALEPFTDDIEIWMEADAGLVRVGSVDYETKGIDDEGLAALIICPLIESPKS